MDSILNKVLAVCYVALLITNFLLIARVNELKKERNAALQSAELWTARFLECSKP